MHNKSTLCYESAFTCFHACELDILIRGERFFEEAVKQSQWRMVKKKLEGIELEREKDEGRDRGLTQWADSTCCSLKDWLSPLLSLSPPLLVNTTEECCHMPWQVTAPWLIIIPHICKHTHSHRWVLSIGRCPCRWKRRMSQMSSKINTHFTRNKELNTNALLILSLFVFRTLLDAACQLCMYDIISVVR